MYIRNRYNKDGQRIEDVHELKITPELQELINELCSPLAALEENAFFDQKKEA